jgi:hypothetical protein
MRISLKYENYDKNEDTSIISYTDAYDDDRAYDREILRIFMATIEIGLFILILLLFTMILYIWNNFCRSFCFNPETILSYIFCSSVYYY